MFAGHTDASYAEVMAGFDAGISGVTHLYNAMSAFVPRAPGVVGAALDRGDVFAGIIVDGHHSHYAAVRLAFAAKGADRLLLVSDAMATAASDCTGSVLNGERIHLREGKLVNDAGTLAGAHLTMAEAVPMRFAMADCRSKRCWGWPRKRPPAPSDLPTAAASRRAALPTSSRSTPVWALRRCGNRVCGCADCE